MKYTVLLAEDDQTACETLTEAFSDKGYTVLGATDGTTALKLLEKEEVDLLITDLVMPGIDGMQLLEKAVPVCPVILMTAYGSVDNAVEAMKLGAFDFVSKPINIHHLFALVERALQMRTLSRDNENLRQRVEEAFDFASMIGRATEMQTVFQQIRQVAPTDTTVCILGESGTGKELVANAIHQHSRRASKPFVKINCAAIPETLLESELFGHEKGSFTGALKQRKGKFELADGGTILLDEISEMDHSLQAKLLRVLQEQEFERVGGNETLKLDVRVIVATNANLAERISDKKFREDLYYRVSVFAIQLPPLRDRRKDIPLLVDYFLRKFSRNLDKDVQGISRDALEAMTAYNWPGNIRQIQNAIERACVMVPEGIAIECSHLPPEISGANPGTVEREGSPAEGPMQLPDVTMDEIERMAIEQALRKFDGNRTQAARALNIGVKTLYRKIEKYTITL
jgi:DNA-binding NtrC family response regulator